MQVPSNLFLNKTGKPALYLPTCMIIWGILSGLTGAVQNFAGLAACRFFLGFIEAAYFPGKPAIQDKCSPILTVSQAVYSTSRPGTPERSSVYEQPFYTPARSFQVPLVDSSQPGSQVT